MHICDLHYCHHLQRHFYEFENLIPIGKTSLGRVDLPNTAASCCFWIKNVAVYTHREYPHVGCSELICCSNDGAQSKLYNYIHSYTMTI